MTSSIITEKEFSDHIAKFGFPPSRYTSRYSVDLLCPKDDGTWHPTRVQYRTPAIGMHNNVQKRAKNDHPTCEVLGIRCD